MITSELVKQFIDQLDKERYFGKVELSIQNGKVMCVDTKEQLKTLDIEKRICDIEKK